MKRWSRVVNGLIGLVATSVVMVACSDGSAAPTEPASPPIPVFGSLKICKAWSCESGRCGYDTAHDPGACCVLYGTGYPTPKPSCRGCPGGFPTC